MKSTEIEVERVVSTSGLLTGRPNASWPPRVPALPWRTNIKTCFSLLPSARLRSQPLFSPHNSPTLMLCGVHCTQCNSYADARHTHADTCTSARRRWARFGCVESKPGLFPFRSRGWGWGWGGGGPRPRRPARRRLARRRTVSYHWAVPGQSCVTGIRINDSPPLHCLVYHPLPPSLSPLSNYKTN